MSEAPKILADTGGLVITDDGRRVVVIDRGTGTWLIVGFVLAVLAAVTLGFGVVALSTGTPSTTLGAVIAGVGIVIAAVAVWVFRKVRAYRARPLGECRPAAVLDRKLGLFSVAGGALMAMDQVRFERRMQITSSSAKLIAVLPGGTRVIKRGSPFDGGIGNAADVLNAVLAAQPADDERAQNT